MTTRMTFEEALSSLGSGGTESAVAAFQLGSEGERLEQWTPSSPGLDRDWAADTILRIESALRVAATDDLFGPASYPGTTPLRQVLRAVTPDTRGTPLSDVPGQLAGQPRHALLVSRADGPLPGPGATAPAAAPRNWAYGWPGSACRQKARRAGQAGPYAVHAAMKA